MANLQFAFLHIRQVLYRKLKKFPRFLCQFTFSANFKNSCQFTPDRYVDTGQQEQQTANVRDKVKNSDTNIYHQCKRQQ
jgi:hypothetical protein